MVYSRPETRERTIESSKHFIGMAVLGRVDTLCLFGGSVRGEVICLAYCGAPVLPRHP
jgi:hypothetical protein